MAQDLKREEFGRVLREILGETGGVYFQPPTNVIMKYPAIVYNRDDINQQYADNSTYRHMTRYQVTHISKDPDDSLKSEFVKLPYCSYSRFYTADDLNHDVYYIFF